MIGIEQTNDLHGASNRVIHGRFQRNGLELAKNKDRLDLNRDTEVEANRVTNNVIVDAELDPGRGGEERL